MKVEGYGTYPDGPLPVVVLIDPEIVEILSRPIPELDKLVRGVVHRGGDDGQGILQIVHRVAVRTVLIVPGGREVQHRI